MQHVQEINDLDELSYYRVLWNTLLAQTPGASFFQSFDWLQTYWKHFGGRQRLRVLIISDEQGPLGILPLAVWTERTRAGRVRVLGYPLADWGTFYGPIGPNPTATLTLGLQHLARTPRDWDLLDLRWVDVEGRDHGRTRQAMELAGFGSRCQRWMQGAAIDLSGTWDGYWAGRAKKWRHNVRNLQRRLDRQGEVNFVRFRPAARTHDHEDPRLDLYDACADLARRSWQGSSRDGTTLCHEEVAAYLRDTHRAAARAGAVDLNLLLVDGSPIAFLYNYHCQGNLFALRAGFDPQWAASGPGTVLWNAVLEDSFARGDRHFDLGVGSLEAKQPWMTRTVNSFRYTHFPALNPQAQMLRLRRWFQDRFADADGLVAARSQ